MREYKRQCDRGFVVAEVGKQTVGRVEVRNAANLRSAPQDVGLDNRQAMHSTLWPRHPPEATNSSGGEQCRVPMRNPPPSAALPGGKRCTAVAHTSTNGYDGHEAALKYTTLDVAKNYI